MNPDIPKHPKLEKARIISSILNCYSNREDVTIPIVTKEDFTKSLNEGDKFFEKKTILEAIEKAQNNPESIKALNDMISKSEKKIVKDGLKSTEVYIVKAEDISSEEDEVEKSDDDDSDDEMEDESEDSENSEEVEKACVDLKKSENLDIIKGGKRAQIGEIREYSGKKFQKQSNGEWKPYKSKGDGAESLKDGDIDVTEVKSETSETSSNFMKQLFRNSTHTQNKSHDCLIAEIGNIKNGGKKVKITYEANNGVERCNIEFFDGDKWSHILSMLDMGVEPNTSAYNIWDEKKRKIRADELFKKAETMCKGIL